MDNQKVTLVDKKGAAAKMSAGTLYDMNKEMMRKESPINKRQYKNKLEEIEQWFEKKHSKYFMLLCHEERNYTLFNLTNFDEKRTDSLAAAREGLKECIDNRGRIISIDYQKETDAYEIWILVDGTEPCCYMLFEYSIGVIEC